DVYALTSPWHLTWHVGLRKAYSVGAFALVGYAVRRALDDRDISRNVGWNVAAIAVYSAFIELAQALAGSNEGLGWNAIDVACGALGGLLGELAVRAFDRLTGRLTRRSVREPPQR
ncbi:MAG: hypothetical protein ABI346_08195, partial [Candidatus Baltobacteraceae bacterium]